MALKENISRTYLQILKEELVPAMGCTEPIALGYAAAKARELLGQIPTKVLVSASGSIIKNVKSVIVPNTGGRKGIEAAVAAGIVAGRADRELEVIAEVSDAQRQQIAAFLEKTEIVVSHQQGGAVFDLTVTLLCGSHRAVVRIANHHTHLVYLEQDGNVLLDLPVQEAHGQSTADRSCLNAQSIWEFCQTVPLELVQDVLDTQIRYNSAIALEGLRKSYGANIGRVLLQSEGDSIRTRAKALAAAGSDARMNGCEMPVIINSGSGNQGITCSVPVIEYARELGASKEQLLRALTLSNLIAIYQKTGIGTLSAYCGAVCAGAAAGAGIAYLHGGGFEEVAHTIVNALAIISGMVCDGAKASCAAKIAMAVEAGILGYEMYTHGQQFYAGDGLVTTGVDATIRNIGRLGKDGMAQTNSEIIEMMVGSPCGH